MGILFIIMHSYKLGSDNNANQNVKDLYANPGRLKKISVEEPGIEALRLPHLVYVIRKFAVIRGRLKPALTKRNELYTRDTSPVKLLTETRRPSSEMKPM